MYNIDTMYSTDKTCNIDTMHNIDTMYNIDTMHNTGAMPDPSPIEVDTQTQVQDPICLTTWIQNNLTEINKCGKVSIFGDGHQLQVSTCDRCQLYAGTCDYTSFK